jgi:hypothetical protein
MRTVTRMKSIRSLAAAIPLGGLTVFLALMTSSCGPNASSDGGNPAIAQERDRLLSENKSLDQARADNQEVQRLKTELQELAKARSQYQEANRLRKENAQLSAELAKLSPNSRTNQAAGGDPRSGIAGSLQGQSDAEKKPAVDENTINEPDEVLVDPKYLKTLLPDFDWDKYGRTQAVSIRSLIEKDGVQLTNVAQLQDYGITNFIVRRIPPTNVVPQLPRP